MKKIVFNSAIVSFFASIFLGFILVFFDSFSILTKIFLLFFSMFGFSVTSLCSYFKRKNNKLISSVSLIISLIGFFYSLLLIFNILNENLYFDIFYTIIIIASFLAILCLSFIIENDDLKVIILKNITILILALLEILLLANVWLFIISQKIIMLVILLFIVLALVTILLNGLNYKKSEPKVKEISKYEKLDELKVLLDTLTISKADFDREKDLLLNNKKKKK